MRHRTGGFVKVWEAPMTHAAACFELADLLKEPSRKMERPDYSRKRVFHMTGRSHLSGATGRADCACIEKGHIDLAGGAAMMGWKDKSSTVKFVIDTGRVCIFIISLRLYHNQADITLTVTNLQK